MTACTEPVVHFPLRLAMLCLQCEAVAKIAPACPACASEQIVPLERFLTKGPRE